MWRRAAGHRELGSMIMGVDTVLQQYMQLPSDMPVCQQSEGMRERCKKREHNAPPSLCQACKRRQLHVLALKY
jgi:hypothetical protein